MLRGWICCRVGFSLRGAVVLGASCYATRQEPQAGTASERRTDESGSSNGKAGKGETSVQPVAPWEERENSVGLHLLKNIAKDQKGLWDGPKSLRWVDTNWLVPLGGATAAI